MLLIQLAELSMFSNDPICLACRNKITHVFMLRDYVLKQQQQPQRMEHLELRKLSNTK